MCLPVSSPTSPSQTNGQHDLLGDLLAHFSACQALRLASFYIPIITSSKSNQRNYSREGIWFNWPHSPSLESTVWSDMSWVSCLSFKEETFPLKLICGSLIYSMAGIWRINKPRLYSIAMRMLQLDEGSPSFFHVWFRSVGNYWNRARVLYEYYSMKDTVMELWFTIEYLQWRITLHYNMFRSITRHSRLKFRQKFVK